MLRRRALKVCAAYLLLQLGMLPLACQVKPSTEASSPSKTEIIPSAHKADSVVSPTARYLSGKTGVFTLEAFKGKPLLLSIQGVGTPYLSDNLHQLDQVQREWTPRGLAVVALLTALAENESAEKIAAEQQASYPLALATPELLKSLGPVRALPTIVLVDGRGLVRKQYPGSFSSDELNADLQSLIAEQ